MSSLLKHAGETWGFVQAKPLCHISRLNSSAVVVVSVCFYVHWCVACVHICTWRLGDKLECCPLGTIHCFGNSVSHCLGTCHVGLIGRRASPRDQPVFTHKWRVTSLCHHPWPSFNKVWIKHKRLKNKGAFSSTEGLWIGFFSLYTEKMNQFCIQILCVCLGQ